MRWTRWVVTQVVSVAMHWGLWVTLGVPLWWVLHVVTTWHRGRAFMWQGTGGGGDCEDEAMREKKKEKNHGIGVVLSHSGVLVVVEVVETRPRGSCSGDGDVVCEKQYREKKKKNISKHQTEAELVIIWLGSCMSRQHGVGGAFMQRGTGGGGGCGDEATR
ncbi:hypothetical protein EDB89DRAFT_1906386 [Lactarius sanguifluus]|nr:hypothetical protein EDB89DRAFT_1906386 [Lactarius sanguifluus]